jgi:hypothetical protein
MRAWKVRKSFSFVKKIAEHQKTHLDFKAPSLCPNLVNYEELYSPTFLRLDNPNSWTRKKPLGTLQISLLLYIILRSNNKTWSSALICRVIFWNKTCFPDSEHLRKSLPDLSSRHTEEPHERPETLAANGTPFFFVGLGGVSDGSIKETRILPTNYKGGTTCYQMVIAFLHLLFLR